MAFIKEKEILANQLKEKKETESAAKEAVFKRLFQEEEKRKREIEELDNLKAELYFAQFEENERKKAIKEEEKRMNVKMQLQEAERNAKEWKAQQRAEEHRME